MTDKLTKNDPRAPWPTARIVDGGLFAMKFNDGWLVGRALETELVPKRDTNWGAIAALVAAGPLKVDGAAAGAVPDTPVTLNTENGKTFLYHEEENIIMQVFGGINWPLARVFYEIPKGTVHGDLQRQDLNVPTLNAAGISTWGWTWSGHQSMNGDERRASMFMLPYKIDIGVAVFNASSQAFTPIFDWLINNIKFEALNPADKEDGKIIEMVLKNRLDDVIKYSPGLRGFGYKQGFRKVFGVDPVIQTKNKIYGIPSSGDAAKYVLGGA